jgi:vancomycin resistance protein YoaR
MVAGSLGTTMAAVAIALPTRCSGNVYPGTTVQGINISGMSRATSESLLRSTFSQIESNAVRYSFEGQTWNASLADLGMRVDYDTMLERAMAQGRDGSLVNRYRTLLAEGEERHVPLAIQREDATLDSYLAEIAVQIETEPEDARLVRNGAQVDIRDHVTGRRLNIEQARTATIAAVSTGRTSAIELATTTLAPDVTSSQLAGAREAALLLISEPIFFTYGNDIFPVDSDTLTAALAIDRDGTASLLATRIGDRLDAIERAVSTSPRNVKLGWDDGLYVVEDDIDGTALDQETLAKLLTATARSDTRTAPLPITPVRAKARTDNVDELGIEGHLAYGSSSFAGSSDTRATNVVVSANNISYKLVGPGQAFSFNDLLGPITVDNGFVEGTIILGDWAATDLGGGVCQVSTTVFRAAQNAGFRFQEWNPHSWRLGFYEADGSPPGLDAAIYQPNTPDEFEKDLIFENPLDSWLLLMMVVDRDTVYAHLYGRDNGWNVDIFDARVSEPKPIGEPVERENPALAPGERRQVQNAQPGYVVRIRRTVTAVDGTVISDGDFVSDYRSQPEAWEVGPDS